jgi:ABC-type dipeptide/oligopeptide/nickel transport system permease component
VQEPFIVNLVREPASETTVADIILGALGLTGVLLLCALLLGSLLALVLVTWHRRRPPTLDHLPSVSPFTPDPNAPPSSQAQ